jgi:hypothetical protein
MKSDYLILINQEKAKPIERWGRKTTGLRFQDSRVALLGTRLFVFCKGARYYHDILEDLIHTG